MIRLFGFLIYFVIRVLPLIIAAVLLAAALHFLFRAVSEGPIGRLLRAIWRLFGRAADAVSVVLERSAGTPAPSPQAPTDRPGVDATAPRPRFKRPPLGHDEPSGPTNRQLLGIILLLLALILALIFGDWQFA